MQCDVQALSSKDGSEAILVAHGTETEAAWEQYVAASVGQPRMILSTAAVPPESVADVPSPFGKSDASCSAQVSGGLRRHEVPILRTNPMSGIRRRCAVPWAPVCGID